MIMETPAGDTRPAARSSDQTEEGADLLDEQGRLLEGREMAAFGGFVPVADVEESLLRPPPGRTLELPGKDRAAPTGTATVSCTGPDIHSLTMPMLSQYRRAADAPVRGSQ